MILPDQKDWKELKKQLKKEKELPKDSAELLSMWTDYAAICSAREELPTVAGFAGKYLWISKQSFYTKFYNHDDFKEASAIIQAQIEDDLTQNIVKGKKGAQFIVSNLLQRGQGELDPLGAGGTQALPQAEAETVVYVKPEA